MDGRKGSSRQVAHRLSEEERQRILLTPNQVWSWDISYLPTSVKGIWLYLCLVIGVWSRKVVAWDVEECQDAKAMKNLNICQAFLDSKVKKLAFKAASLHETD